VTTPSEPESGATSIAVAHAAFANAMTISTANSILMRMDNDR
jgi:hypothetical protein